MAFDDGLELMSEHQTFILDILDLHPAFDVKVNATTMYMTMGEEPFYFFEN